VPLSTHIEFEASFVGRPGDARDKAAESIVHMYEGSITGAGTFLPTSTRDIQVRCPRIQARPLKEALRKAGLTVEE
jgi:hypothetical protein